jgi:1-phosphofructokinase family hexose kinase
LNPEHQGSAPRILAAGLSPAWQQIMVFDDFRPGEVNRAREVDWCASGKVLNVGIALAHLRRSQNVEVHSPVLSVIGPRARAAIEPEFARLGIDCRWIQTAAETRICTTIVDRAAGRTTELVENAAPLASNDLDRFQRAFADEAATSDVLVFTGSLPPGVPATFCRDLVGGISARAVLDIRGPELFAALKCRPYCVKPNREELGKSLGRELASDAELHAAMRELNQQGAQWVVITHGPGSVWVSHGDHLYQLQPPRAQSVVNPIASGDCLAAGIAWATACGRDMPDAIRFGIAAAVDNVGQLLPARIDPARIAQLEKEVAVEEL